VKELDSFRFGVLEIDCCNLASVLLLLLHTSVARCCNVADHSSDIDAAAAVVDDDDDVVVVAVAVADC